MSGAKSGGVVTAMAVIDGGVTSTHAATWQVNPLPQVGTQSFAPAVHTFSAGSQVAPDGQSESELQWPRFPVLQPAANRRVARMRVRMVRRRRRAGAPTRSARRRRRTG